MQPIKLALLALTIVLVAPSVADAQYRRGGGGYYQGGAPSSQLPGGFWNRQGRLIFGASLGIGHMSDDFGDIECTACDYKPISGMGAAHIGGFLGPRFALMGEVQVNIQTVEHDSRSGDTTQLVHSALMIAGQYWILPQLWVKGGIGFANLQLERSYYGDGITDETSAPENGLALMGAVGFEVFSSRALALDLEGRIINGSFDGIDNRITGATIGLGLSFY